MTVAAAESRPNRCGYVVLVGRANVGKSTLLNHLLGQKIAITSRKPQTTRHPLTGIRTEGAAQLLIMDTPGVQEVPQRALDRHMNRAALGALADVDVITMLVDRDAWTTADDFVLAQVRAAGRPALCVITKIDRLESSDRLLPIIARLSGYGVFQEIVPVSALRNRNLDRLLGCIAARLPIAAHLYPDDQITDRDERFLVQEIVREKLIRQLGQELPYTSTVVVESFRVVDDVTHIHAVIFVERAGQKAIIIGKGGLRLRAIGIDARRDIETLLQSRVMLDLWVKVRSGWSDDDRALKNLGY